MKKLRILNTREIKPIRTAIKEQFGCDFFEDFVFLQNLKDRIFITNKDIAKIDLDRLRINSIGLYFGEFRQKKLRLSIEGSQIIGKLAKKNILTLNEKEAKEWMSGNDILVKKRSLTPGSFVILQHKKDILGCGKYNGEKVMNYVPKERRI